MKKKNYYDLSGEELKKYNEEFKKTPGGYSVNLIRIFFQSLLIIFNVVYFIGTIIAIGNNEMWVMMLLLFLCVLVLLLNFLPIIYYNYNYNKWLKEKYNI